MAREACFTCGKKTTKTCALCEQKTCKVCAHNLPKDSFLYLDVIPENLRHFYYCNDCFHKEVQEPLNEYEEVLAKAKEMEVFLKNTHTRKVKFFHKAPKQISVNDCPDYDELILKLAYIAAKEGYNCIVNVDLVQRKVHDGGYKTLLWSGTATPANQDLEEGF